MKPWSRVVLLAIAAVALGGCATSAVRAPDPLDEAQRRLLRNPSDVGTQVELSELFLQQRDYLRARQYLSLAEQGMAGRATPGLDSGRVFRLAIVIAVRSQQYSEAVRYCTQKLEEAEDSDIRSLLATLLETAGEPEEAARQLQLLLVLHADQPRRLIDLARFYERSTHLERRRLSRELYQRYLEAAPQGADSARVRAALTLDQIERRGTKE